MSYHPVLKRGISGYILSMQSVIRRFEILSRFNHSIIDQKQLRNVYLIYFQLKKIQFYTIKFIYQKSTFLS